MTSVPPDPAFGSTTFMRRLFAGFGGTTAAAGRACGCCGVARADIMLAEDMTPYVIEINSMPGMTETSLVPDAGRAMGVEFPELCERILEMAGYEK